MWSPPIQGGLAHDSQELSVYSRPTNNLGTTVEGHDYTPNTPDFPERTSHIPLLHKDFSHEQTSPSKSTIGRDAHNQYPSPDEPSREHRSQTRWASTRRHPFASQFEAPDWQQLLIHSVLCFLAYPLLLLVALIASSRPLFWTRTIVGLGCGLIGLTLGLIPLALAQKFLEAAGGFLILQLDQFANATLQRGPPLFTGHAFQMLLASNSRTLPRAHQIRRVHCPPYNCFGIDGSIRGPLGNIASITSQYPSVLQGAGMLI
jgi:hypothetical protein